jgi:hypothetical protein
MQKFHLTRWKTPLILLIVCVVSFGLLIPTLGFFWDDWPVVYIIQNEELDFFWDFYAYDRPISAWTYLVTAPLFGTEPIYWHIFTLIVRWLVVWGVWEVLRTLWPSQERTVTWIAIFFAVYPTFFQQPIAVAYSQHFLTFGLFVLSIYLMLRAIHLSRGRRWMATIFGVAFGALSLLTMEYVAGLELIRPVLLWMIVGPEITSNRKRLKEILIRWMPYLIVLVVFIFWRLFILEIPDDPNSPRLLMAFRESPMNAAIDLVQRIIRDLVYVWLNAWFQIVQPESIDLRSRFELFAWGIAFLLGLGLILILRSKRHENEKDENTNWIYQAIFLGAFSTLVGLFPVWFTWRDILTGRYSDRFTLPAMLGASIFTVALINILISKETRRVVFLGIIVSLAVGNHIRITNEYKWDWVLQKRYYWQMLWRIPGMQSDTPVVVNDSITGFVDKYTAAMAVNTLYPQAYDSGVVSYWLVDGGNYVDYIQAFLEGKTIRGGIRNLTFKGFSQDSLVLYGDIVDHCIWLLTPSDVNNKEIPDHIRELTPRSNLDRVLLDEVPVSESIEAIIGPEPVHGWCYYFQKADLARQLGEWERVLEIWEETEQKGLVTEHGYEDIPFIEAHIVLGSWDEAARMTSDAFEKTLRTRVMLCSVWDRYQPEFGDNADFNQAFDKVRDSIGCP